MATFESGDNNYESITAPVGCNEDQERFVVSQAPTIQVDKTADPEERNEPGGTFTFDVVVTNTGPNDVTITSLTDDVYGDLNDETNPEVANNTCANAVGTTIAANGGTFTCSFDGEFTGNAGDSETDTVTATAEDETGQEATDSDEATVTLVLPESPTIQVDKTADPVSQPEPGGTFTFDVDVTNTGPNDVTITSLTDDVYGDLNDPFNPNVEDNTCAGAVGTAVPAGATFSCSFDGEFTGNAGDSETDTVTATAEDATGQEATDSDDATVTLVGVPLMVDIVKTADPTSQPEPGGTFTFDVEITNTSDSETITLDALTDDVYGDLFDPANPNVTSNTCEALAGTTLAPAESTTCAFEGEFTGASGDSETDTVTVEVSDDDGDTATASDDATVTLTPGPTINVDKTADPIARQEPGGTFTFDVEVTNTHDQPLVITSLTDDIYGDIGDPANPNVTNNDCPDLIGDTLAPGESTTCSFDAEFTGSAGDSQTDVVTVVGTDEFGNEATDDDDATVTLIVGEPPTVQVDKTADPTSQPEPGGTFNFTVEITNTSDETVTITSLTDDVYGDLNDAANPDVENNTCAGIVGTELDPDESTTCSFDGEFTGNAGDSETDTVTVAVEDEDGIDATDDDDATVTIVEGQQPTVRVDKTADPVSQPEPGGTFTFDVEVTNTHDQPVVITSLTDDIYGDIGDPANPNVSNNDCPDLIGDTLEPDESTTCSFDAEFTGNAGDEETDTVTVVVTDEFGNDATDDDDATVTITADAPQIRVDKDADPQSRPAPAVRLPSRWK